MLLISVIALSGVFVTLDAYIRGVCTNLLSTVICHFNESFLCFQMLVVDFSVSILRWKLCLYLFHRYLLSQCIELQWEFLSMINHVGSGHN